MHDSHIESLLESFTVIQSETGRTAYINVRESNRRTNSLYGRPLSYDPHVYYDLTNRTSPRLKARLIDVEA